MAEVFETVTQRARSGRIVTFRRRVSPRRFGPGGGGPGPYDPVKLLALGERRCRENGEATSARNIARQLGVTRRTIVRWRTGNTVGVQLHVADRVTNRADAYLEDFRR